MPIPVIRLAYHRPSNRRYLVQQVQTAPNPADRRVYVWENVTAYNVTDGRLEFRATPSLCLFWTECSIEEKKLEPDLLIQLASEYKVILELKGHVVKQRKTPAGLVVIEDQGTPCDVIKKKRMKNLKKVVQNRDDVR